MSHPPFHRIERGVLLVLLLTASAGAVPTFKVSSYGGGHQIWFEAEDSDERVPTAPDYSPVVDQAGAFGKAVGRTGEAGGRIMWTFDISAAGGKGGTWYFFGRVLNPNNRSDYLLVEGDPGDAVIPATAPFPGGNEVAPFLNADDQIFEETVAAWNWVRTNHSNGHTKELKDGKNTMYIFRREGPNATVFWDVFVWADNPAYRPTDDDYRNAQVFLPGKATNPSPASGATDVPRDVSLSWTAGALAGQRDVYFGTDEGAVGQATATVDPAGVYKGRIDATTYSVPLLAYGQTYYWRVDEVNRTPDNYIFKGTVWSFTVEPYEYTVKPLRATASSAQANMGPEKTIDGSGMTGDLHGTAETSMWLSAGVLPNWIQYEFDHAYTLSQMQVWNSNQLFESFLGFGAKQVTIETSLDGTTWTALPDVPEFARAPAAAGYAANTTVNFGGVSAKYVKLTLNTTWGGLTAQAGLAEVRFSHVPLQARAPQPANGAKGVGVDTALNWRPGRQAASHQVFFGTDPSALTAGQTVTDHRYDPGSLNFGTTYYWKVNEVNTVKGVTYPGDVWSFTTQEYATVDDMESYTDDEGSRIYQTWIDGWTNGTGSTVGYVQAPFAERKIVHGGKQSMPVDYNNTKSPFYSEAERTWDKPQDWTAGGADTLVLYFQGRAAGFLDKGAGSFALGGGGTDIWNTVDQFRFAAKKLTGNGAIVAKVESLVNTDPWAKVGVMIRESMAPGSRFAAVYATPGNGVRYQARLMTDAAAVSDTAVATPEQIALRAPIWVKMERAGNNFSGSYSTDGVKWTAMSWNPQAINMAASPVYIGLCATSHNANASTTGEFSNVSTTGTVAGAWEAAEIGVAQPSNTAASLYVVVQDSAGKGKVIKHPDPAATTLATWQQWRIPLSDLSAGGVKLTAVKKLSVGVGDRANPTPDGAGLVYLDDIGVGHPAAGNP
jgi:hypothetical protein